MRMGVQITDALNSYDADVHDQRRGHGSQRGNVFSVNTYQFACKHGFTP